jgi:hypothetical protein
MADGSNWTFGSHGSLEKWDDDLYTVRGEISLLPIGRVMSVVRLVGGDLLIHSAVAGSPELMREIEALGPIKYLVVPSASHKMDAPRFRRRYPDAVLVTPDAGRTFVEKKVHVDGNYDLLPVSPRFSWEMLDGVSAEAVFKVTDRAGRVTLIFNDALMNLPDRLPGFRGFVTRAIGSTGGPKVTWTARTFIVKDTAAYGRHLLRLSEMEGLTRVIVGHGEPITENPSEVLRQVASTLR